MELLVDWSHLDKPKKKKRKGLRIYNENPRKKGTNPRAKGTNPRKTSKKSKNANKKQSTRQIYNKYIDSKKWKIRREKYFLKYEFKCNRCLRERDIHLHHMSYERIGREPDSDLIALCKKCHKEYHQKYGTQRNMKVTTLEFINSYEKTTRR